MNVDATPQKLVHYKSINGLSSWVQGIFVISGILSIVSLFSRYLQSELLSKALNGNYFTLAEAQANDSREAMISFVQLVFIIIGAIIFLMWVYRANKIFIHLKDHR